MSLARNGRVTGWTWSATPNRTASRRTTIGRNAWRYRDYVIRALQRRQAV